MVNLEMALGNLLLFVFVILEVLILKYYLKQKLPWKELIINLNSGHIVLWIFRGMEVLAYYYTVKYFSLHLVGKLPYYALWILAFIFWDFLFYWLHRTHHFFKILWSIHVVHHEGEHYSLSLGIRNSWYSSLSSFPYFVIMAILGFPLEIFVSVSSIHYFIQFYNHNSLVKKSFWLEKIMITPAHHRVHHGRNQPYVDKNFGGTFVFWDKLFGTFQVEENENPVVFGINDSTNSLNPQIINNIPFAKQVTNVEPISPKIETITVPNSILITNTIILFSQLLFFIYVENALTIMQKLIFFSILFVGTLGTGFISDNQTKMGLISWFFSGLILPSLLLLFNPISSIIFNAIAILSLLHILFSLIWYTTAIYSSKNN